MNFSRRRDLTPAAMEVLHQYDQAVREIVGPEYAQPIRMREWELWRVLNAMEGTPPQDRILEIGSYNTFLTAYLARRFPRVTASDLMRQRCRKSLLRRLRLAPPKPTEAFYFEWTKIIRRAGVEIRNLDAARLTCPSASYDCIIAISVIEHIPQVERALAELHRVLAPGGRLLLTTDCAREAKPYSAGVRYFSPAELATMLAPYAVTSFRNEPDFSDENWCYHQNLPVVTAFIEITKPR
ncbi:MAG: methyltransferase domain-containing protein [Opitutales bacterium]